MAGSHHLRFLLVALAIPACRAVSPRPQPPSPPHSSFEGTTMPATGPHREEENPHEPFGCLDAPPEVVMATASRHGMAIESCEDAAQRGLCTRRDVAAGCRLSCGTCSTSLPAPTYRLLQSKSSPSPPPPLACEDDANRCSYLSDGYCDDGGPGAQYNDCSCGTGVRA